MNTYEADTPIDGEKLPSEIKYEVSDHVATITLNRPEKLNAMLPSMGRSLAGLVSLINQDDSVRVVILRGAPGKAFSVGSDVSALDDYGSNWELRNRVDYGRAIWAIRKPVICAIHGFCIGGGLEMALMSDIRIASPDARFAAGEIKLGWLGGAGATQLLPRTTSKGFALKMLLTGDQVTAAEAQVAGLVDQVVPAESLEQEARALAQRIVANAPIAAQLIKHLVRMSESTSLEVGLNYENDLFAYCFTTDDSREGREAFLEKRAPGFMGR